MTKLFNTGAHLTTFEAADVVIDYHINAEETEWRHFQVTIAPSVSADHRAEIFDLLKAHGCVEANGKWLQPADLNLNLTFVGMLEFAKLRVFQMTSWSEIDEPTSEKFDHLDIDGYPEGNATAYRAAERGHYL
jgi:hypothetical protein